MLQPGRSAFRRAGALCVLFAVVFGLVLTPAAQAAPTEHLVYNIIFNHPSPNILALNQDLTFTFSYKTSHPGVRIFFRPMTGGAPTQHYAAHGSPVHPAGTGAASGFFTITTGEALVDHVRIQMWTEDGNTLLFQAKLPVHYQFRDTTHLVSNVALSPHTPNVMPLDQDVSLTFAYATNHLAGVRIWARPFTNGAATPGYGAHGSPLYLPGTGTGSGSFRIIDAPAVVDEIRLQMWTSDETTLLFEAFLPVHYDFREPGNLVTHVALSPPSPNILDFGQQVTFDFAYQTTNPGGVRIFGRPLTHGDTTANYAAHGSPVYTVGTGTGSGNFTITAWPNVVDQLRLQMWNEDQSALLFEAQLPVYYQFGAPQRVLLPAVMQ